MATSMTQTEAQRVASLPKQQGCLMLAQYLHWDIDLNDDANMRESILLDYLHDTLMFAVDHGFPWLQVCSIVDLAREIQQQTIGQPLSFAIQLYRQKSLEYAHEGRISDKNLKIFTSHFFATFMRHYKLYQFVFTKPRLPMVTQHELCVETPPDVFSLKDSKPNHIWEYNQKLASIETEEQARMEVLQTEKENLLQQEPGSEKPLSLLNNSEVPIERENLSQVIKEAVNLQGNYTERLLQAQVEEVQEDLDYYFEKTALPRPAALGPPPRTKSPPRVPPKNKTASIKSGVADGKKKSLGSELSKGSAKSSRSKTPKSVKS
ncbi:uncharacterized protein C8orf74 homolog [Asterias amurensis]|uniref:uncharacterized protein C8orf74 homolog n=1 Tax=Asterias amurensis TaxID=7602 RepID=UPI003AB7F0E5